MRQPAAAPPVLSFVRQLDADERDLLSLELGFGVDGITGNVFEILAAAPNSERPPWASPTC